jgi:hypothetical protein
MTIRFIGLLLCGAVMFTATVAPADDRRGIGIYIIGAKMKGEGSGQPGPAGTTTVKSSKSNTSDRMGGVGNPSDGGTIGRMGGGGGKGTAGGIVKYDPAAREENRRQK